MPNKQDLLITLQNGKKQIERLSGNQKLDLLIELLKTAKRHSAKTAEDLLNEHLQLIESTSSEESAILLGEKAFFCFQRASVDDTEKYTSKALSIARDCGSNTAEAQALVLKGYIDDVKGQHKKVTACYAKALDKCSELQRSGILLDMGTSLSKQGEYKEAWLFMSEAIKAAKTIIKDKSLSKEDRLNQTRVQAEALSRLGTLNESIGDFDAVQRNYEQAISISKKNGFVWENYKALSRKVKLLLYLGKITEAEITLREAERLPLSGHDPRAQMYIANDWARIYRASNPSCHDEAIGKYLEILYGNTSNEKEIDDRLHDLMENQADLLGEILSGMIESLFALGKGRDAERLEKVKKDYEDALSSYGIYKEIDKKSKLQKEREKVADSLSVIFKKKPLEVRYKDVFVKYDPDLEKAIYKTKQKTGAIPKRAFFILKSLNDHIGEWVTKEELRKSLEDEEEAIGDQDIIREYISRYIRKKLGLNQHLKQRRKKHPEKGGWLLVE